MTKYQSKFLDLKEEDKGRVILGKNASTRTIGKGTDWQWKTKAHNVLYFEGLEHNPLSVIQMHDDITFHSKGREIRKAQTRKLVAKGNKTSSNVYILDGVKEEKCCMGKMDESLL